MIHGDGSTSRTETNEDRTSQDGILPGLPKNHDA